MLASELQLPPDVAFVGLARLLVTSSARLAGMGEERIEDLRIAVSEATTNAVLAHQRSEPPGQVVLQFGATGNEIFQVLVLDTVPDYVPDTPGDLGRSVTHENSLGVTIIRGLTDGVEFVTGEGTQIHMRFALELAASGLPDGDRAGA